MGPVLVLWAMLLFLPTQEGFLAMSWEGALAIALGIISIGWATLGFFARRRGLPFFILSFLFLLFASAFSLIGFDEYKLYQATLFKEQRVKEVVAEIRLGRR